MSPSVFENVAGAAVDERLRRVVGHEMARQLRRDEVRGRRRAGQEVEHLLAFFLAVPGRELVAEDRLLARIVNVRD